MKTKTQHTPKPWYLNQGLSEKEKRLIAAAPEMLEALEQAIKVFNQSEIDGLQAFAMIEKMKGLVSKAKGQDHA